MIAWGKALYLEGTPSRYRFLACEVSDNGANSFNDQPIYVQHTIKSQIKDQTGRRFGKSIPTIIRTRWLSKIGGVSPSANGKQDFELAVLLLQKIQLLHASVNIVTGIIPGVTRIVLFNVGPAVGQESAEAKR